MSVYHDACICHSSYYETLTSKMSWSKYEMRVCRPCFSISICYGAWRQGSSCPLFYINTWAMISGWLTDYPALAGEVLWRKKIFSSCELEMCAAQTLTAPQRVALTAWQSHRQSQWHPSSLSLSPGRMILVCLSIHADTSTSMTYMQIQQRYIQIQIH